MLGYLKRFYSCCMFRFIGIIFIAGAFITEQSSDTRGGDTNGALQLSYILKQPFAYAVVLGKNVIDTLQDSFMGPKALNSFAYLGDGKYSALCAAFLTEIAFIMRYIWR